MCSWFYLKYTNIPVLCLGDYNVCIASTVSQDDCLNLSKLVLG